jgi:hypothetical protein
MKACLFILSLLTISVLSASDATLSAVTLDSKAFTATSIVTCSGVVGTDVDTVYVGAAPTSSKTTFTVASIVKALGDKTSVVADYIYQASAVVSGATTPISVSYVGLNNSNAAYTITAFCALKKDGSSGKSAAAEWTQPDNGGKAVVFRAAYNNVFDVQKVSQAQKAALTTVLKLNSQSVYDLFGSVPKTFQTYNINGSAVSTFVLRDYTLSSDTFGQSVIDLEKLGKYDDLKAELNKNLATLGDSLNVTSITAVEYTPVTPNVTVSVNIVNATNITVTLTGNTAGVVAVVGDLSSVADKTTYKPENILKGTDDKGTNALYANASILLSNGSLTLNYVNKDYKKFSFYAVVQSGVGEYQTYSTVNQSVLYVPNNNGSSNVDKLTALLNTTTVNLTVTCSGAQGIDFDEALLVATPDNSALSYSLAQVRAGKNQSFISYGRLSFPADQSTTQGLIAFTTLKNANTAYTLNVYCALSSSQNNGTANNATWTQPDNGGKDVVFTATFNGTAQSNLTTAQALALVKALNLDGNYVYDEKGNKALAAAPSVNSKTRLLADDNTTNATFTVKTLVVRNFYAVSDNAGAAVIKAANTSDFLANFNSNLTALNVTGVVLQNVSADNYTVVNPTVSTEAPVITSNNNGVYNVTFKVNLASSSNIGSVGYVASLTNNTVNQTYTSVQKILAGTSDQGITQDQHQTAVVSQAVTSVTFLFTTNVTDQYTVYVAATNTLGTYQLYSNVVSFNVTAAGGSFGWRFGVLVLAVLGLIFFN